MPYDATPAPPPPVPAATPVAPWLHTFAVLLVLRVTAFATHARAGSSSYLDTPRLGRYTTSILAEWVLLGAVIAGLYVRRSFFDRAMLQRLPALAQTLGLGAAVYVVSLFAVAAVRLPLQFTPLAHKVNLDVILAMSPHTPFEFVLWFFVSLSAGICEELIFRGYLLQQFTAWLRSPVAAILVTGLLFGCVHLYEGLGAVLPLATLGILYGFVTRYTKGDLRAVMAAHFLQDFLVAFLVMAVRHMPHSPLSLFPMHS